MTDERLDKIINGASSVFMRCGIKSVNMDDVARELKMSKKTLYKYVRDKLDLVCKVMSKQCNHDRTMMEQVMVESENAVDEIIRISQFVSDQLQQIHPSIHYDLQKYYPEAWDLFYNHKNSFILDCVTDNLKRGIAEGLYRDNINVEILGRLYVAKIDMVFDAEVFPPRDFKFTDVHREMVRYHIRGIASEKGKVYLQKRFGQDQSNF